jgi:hypothetical protein
MCWGEQKLIALSGLQIRMDLHYSGKLNTDPDPHESEIINPEPDPSAMKSKFRNSKYMRNRIRIRIIVKK